MLAAEGCRATALASVTIRNGAIADNVTCVGLGPNLDPTAERRKKSFGLLKAE